MRVYHVIFKTENGEFLSKGENFHGTDPIKAFKKFREKYPAAVFIALYDLEVLSEIKGS